MRLLMGGVSAPERARSVSTFRTDNLPQLQDVYAHEYDLSEIINDRRHIDL